MADSIPKVSRRRFLQTSVAAGVALSLPWLPGCGSDDDDAGSATGPLGARRQSTLHFDLSGFSGDTGPFVLHAIGSRGNRSHLSPHTAATRAEFRASSAPQGISDAQLTHFAKGIDLPARAIQHVWITAGTEPSSPVVLSKLFCGGIDPNNPHTWISPRDTAIALIFHHHELVRLDADQAAIVCAHIESSSALGALATILGKPGAFVGVPATDFDGNPVLDSNGKQLVQHDPSDAVLSIADAVVQDVLERVFDDPELENANWHAAGGRTSVPVADTSGVEALAAAEVEAFEADYPADAREHSSAHGIYFTSLEVIDPAKRTVQLGVKNFWLRWVAAYVDFLSPNGFGVESDEPRFLGATHDYDISGYKTEAGQVVRSRLLSMLGANNDYLGIPVLPAQQSESPLRFVMPPDATVAQVRFISLGLGGNHEPGSEAEYVHQVPYTLTILFNIGVPAALLAAAVGTDPTKVVSFTEIAKDPKLWLDLVRLVPANIYTSVKRDDARPILLAIGSKLVSMALKSIPAFAEKFIEILGLEEAEQSVPILGWGIKLASIGAATAKLGQTVGEVLSSPVIFENRISVMLKTRLDVAHDPEDPAGFPATATRWEMHATYDGKLGKTLRGELPAVLTDPIGVEFQVPSGGTGKIDVWFLTDNNWIAGHGTTGTFANLAAGGVLTQAITITENLVPLSESTRYHHQQKLAISDGHYVWQSAKDAPPTLTAADLICDESGVCALDGITLNESAAVLGYAWQARSRTVPICGTGDTSSPLHRMQNLSFTQRPERGLKQAFCGYAGKPVLAYELRTKPDQAGRHFYLDPNRSAGGFHLRGVALDNAPFEQTSGLSWGQFSQAQNGLAIHPAGYVAGINTQFHKLEILRLPAIAAADALVTASVLKAGFGSRFGLLDTPTAIGVDLKSGAIFVLEGGNARIQAFDVHGNPTARFKGGTSEVKGLHRESGVTYLDMAVESTGWIYVLSFIGNGRSTADYRLDIYDPDSSRDDYVSRTTRVAAGKLAVDLWRNIFTLNFEPLLGAGGPEPSISEWIPSTPDGCSQIANPFCQRI